MNRTRIWISEKHTVSNEETGNIIEFPIGTLEGHFYVELLDAKTKNILNTYSFPNVITNTGLNIIGSMNAGETLAIQWMQAGQGNTTPTGTDSGLVSPLTGLAQNTDGTFQGFGSASDGSGSVYHYGRYTYLFTETQANGNVAEFGTFTLSSGGRLFSRCLAKDSSGTPITISKTSDNQLRVTYEWRFYPPVNSDVSGSLTIGASTYNYTIRPQAIYKGRGWGTFPGVSTINSGVGFALLNADWSSNVSGMIVSPSGSLVDQTGSAALGSTTATPSSVNVSGYIADSYVRDIEYVFEPTQANFGTTGIRGIQWGPLQTATTAFQNSDAADYAQYQMFFTPPLPKDNTKRLKLKFRYAWFRNKTSD